MFLKGVQDNQFDQYVYFILNDEVNYMLYYV